MACTTRDRRVSYPYMEVYMELTKKTTILFSEGFYRNLASVARGRRVSVGKLVRDACEQVYGITSRDEAVTAVEELAALGLPVEGPTTMKRQSVPEPSDLMP